MNTTVNDDNQRHLNRTAQRRWRARFSADGGKVIHVPLRGDLVEWLDKLVKETVPDGGSDGGGSKGRGKWQWGRGRNNLVAKIIEEAALVYQRDGSLPFAVDRPRLSCGSAGRARNIKQEEKADPADPEL